MFQRAQKVITFIHSLGLMDKKPLAKTPSPDANNRGALTTSGDFQSLHKCLV